MARPSTLSSGDSGAGKKLVGLAMTAGPVVLDFLRRLDTPETKENIKLWAKHADRAIRALTLEGRVDARIRVLRAALEKPASAAHDGHARVSWHNRLSTLESQRELLSGPFHARTRRRHLKTIARGLDELWREMFEGVDGVTSADR